MSILVEQQDETINVIEQQAEMADKDLESGSVSSFLLVRCSAERAYLHLSLFSSVQHTEKAVDSARAARKKRWICFIICILIILIIVGVVAGVIISNNNKKK